ncbi:MAG: hypothetical protein ABL921_08045 [Pirellula sp.]
MNSVEFLRSAKVLELSCDVASACPDYESAASIAKEATIQFKLQFERQCSEASRVLACWPGAGWNDDIDDSKHTPLLRAEILTISAEEAIRVATSLLDGVAIEGTLSINDRHVEE